MAWFKKHVESRSSPAAVVAARSDDGEPFLVSGVTHRQDNLERAGAGSKLFRLIRDIGNPHDQWAVKVVYGEHHLGFITAKNARRYWYAVERVESTGRYLQVHGDISRKRDGGFIAQIDCCWPEDIT